MLPAESLGLQFTYIRKSHAFKGLAIKFMKKELVKHVFRLYQNTASELSDHRLVYKHTKSHTKWRNVLLELL